MENNLEKVFIEKFLELQKQISFFEIFLSDRKLHSEFQEWVNEKIITNPKT